MLKPPSSPIPGMADPLEFVKNLWGSMSIPGTGIPGMPNMPSPPLSIEDLDKRIADMKAVESWLNLNLGMLHGTIQAMEVQRGTLATLKSMGSSMAEAMRQSGVSAEKMASMPFGPFFGQQAGARPADAPAAAAASANPAAAAAGKPAAEPAPPDGAAAAAALGMPAAMAWWNMLQDQFTQAVNVAMAPAPDAAKPQPQAAPEAPAAEGPEAAKPLAGEGNGKARASRPKADKA
jgi:hypothetical protein